MQPHLGSVLGSTLPTVKAIWRRFACALAFTACSATGISSASAAPLTPLPPPIPPPASEGSLWKSSWPEFSTLELGLTLAGGVGTGLLVWIGPAEDARWHGGILFDNAVRDELRASTHDRRQAYRGVGDLTYWASPVIPLLLDAALVSLVFRDDPKLAKNLALISLEAFSYSGFLSFLSTGISARARPDSRRCPTAMEGEPECTEDTQSFFSGHTVIAATGAGLVCANHWHIPLWGHPVADAAACVLATGGALTTGVTRVIADRHYVSDVIVGAFVGFGLGYAVPTFLHYARRKTDTSWALTPDPACGGTCLGLTASF